jgi:alanine racemase
MLMAAVKANAYGHGAQQVASHALKNGADRLGVANINEAISLRNKGIKAPILIFGYTPCQSAHFLAEFDLTQAVHSYETALSLSSAVLSLGKSIKIHLKVDTGMGRLGFLQINDNSLPLLKEECKKTVNEALSISRLKGIELEGIFTHFATADFFDKSYAKAQFCRFMDFIDAVKRAGVVPQLLHAANSAALIDMPETHLDMVRPGISIYGLYPSDEIDKTRVDLKPAMTLKTKIIHLKKVPAGFKISYGITYETKNPTTIATVPIGYADGFNRLLSSRGFMLVNGSRAPVVGRVCMDLTMLDVGHIPDVGLEDEVVVIGRQKEECISADEIAAATNTINYEVVTSIGARAERVYKGLVEGY